VILPCGVLSRFTPPNATMAPAKGKQAKGKQAEKPVEAQEKTIWYLLIDHVGKLSFGNLTALVVQADITVAALMKRIKEEHPDLGPFNANKLEPWTYKHKDFSVQSKSAKLKTIIGGIKFSEASRNPNPLLPAQKVTNINLPKDGILLVRVPPPQITDTATASGKGS
jgi:hypothetical protein